MLQMPAINLDMNSFQIEKITQKSLKSLYLLVKNKTISISDNGIGMGKDELISSSRNYSQIRNRGLYKKT